MRWSVNENDKSDYWWVKIKLWLMGENDEMDHEWIMKLMRWIMGENDKMEDDDWQAARYYLFGNCVALARAYISTECQGRWLDEGCAPWTDLILSCLGLEKWRVLPQSCDYSVSCPGLVLVFPLLRLQTLGWLHQGTHLQHGQLLDLAVGKLMEHAVGVLQHAQLCLDLLQLRLLLVPLGPLLAYFHVSNLVVQQLQLVTDPIQLLLSFFKCEGRLGFGCLQSVKV